ncbi:glucose-6-phosphate 1-dehydrogenase [Nematocida sp. AWRm79]|nr:glucose-6-phosphate 1-dehydrogenase [Nematocida sp. AWRm79]
MIIIAGCTGDLSKKKLFPAINKVFRRELYKCTNTNYTNKELDLTDATLSSSTSAHNLSKYSPITHANPKDSKCNKNYLEATESKILYKKILQGDLLINNNIKIPRIIGYARSILSNTQFIQRIDPNISYLKETISNIEYFNGEYKDMVSNIYGMINTEYNTHSVISNNNDTLCDKLYNDNNTEYNEGSVISNNNDTLCDKLYNDNNTEYNTHGVISNEPIYFYLAVPPEVYPNILKSVKILKNNGNNGIFKLPILLIEKPIGTSLNSFLQLKQDIQSDLDRFLCVDHYLFKNIMVMYKNLYITSILQDIIVPEHISEVKAYFNEVIGVSGRESYYNTSGACRDVLQNHLLLIISTVLAGSNSRLSILQDITALTEGSTVFGVYKEYYKVISGCDSVSDSVRASSSETSLEKISKTKNIPNKEIKNNGNIKNFDIKETFIRTITKIGGNWNIPLKMTAGKKMSSHFVGVILIMKESGILKFAKQKTDAKDYENLKLLEKIIKKLENIDKLDQNNQNISLSDDIRVETDESINESEESTENFDKTKNTKKTTISGKIKIKITPKEEISVELKYKNKLAKKVNIPIPKTEDKIDAYEHLFHQLIFKEDYSNFSALSEIEEQWRIVDPILDSDNIRRIYY